MNSQHLNEKKITSRCWLFWKNAYNKNRKEDEVAIMLIQFNFKNFRSFREEATLDLSATKMTEFFWKSCDHRKRKDTIGSLPFYGANASVTSQIYTVHLSIW